MAYPKSRAYAKQKIVLRKASRLMNAYAKIIGTMLLQMQKMISLLNSY